MAAAPRDWRGRSRAIESALLAFQVAGAFQACAEHARDETPTLPSGPSHANAAAIGLECALAAPAGGEWRQAALAALEPVARGALTMPGVLVDDRSGLYEALIELRLDRGDAAGAKALAADWWVFLDSEAANATTPEARAALDPHRTEAAIKLGDPGRAVPILVERERELPDDYNAPARLAILYREMGKYDEALGAADRALAKAYGPRKVRVYETKAGIYEKKGDAASARRTLQDALRYAESLPKAQHADALAARVKAALAKM